MADCVDGCRITSISTACPTRRSRISASLPISRRENASGSKHRSRPCSPSLAKFASLEIVALHSGIWGSSSAHVPARVLCEPTAHASRITSINLRPLRRLCYRILVKTGAEEPAVLQDVMPIKHPRLRGRLSLCRFLAGLCPSWILSISVGLANGAPVRRGNWIGESSKAVRLDFRTELRTK